MNEGATNALVAMESQFEILLQKMSVEDLLKYRDTLASTHRRQLEKVNVVLKDKGYVEEHLRKPEGGHDL